MCLSDTGAFIAAIWVTPAKVPYYIFSGHPADPVCWKYPWNTHSLVWGQSLFSCDAAPCWRSRASASCEQPAWISKIFQVYPDRMRWDEKSFSASFYAPPVMILGSSRSLKHKAVIPKARLLTVFTISLSLH